MSDTIRVDLTPKIHLTFKTQYDEDGDSSYLGEFTDKRGEYCFDRENGVLLGEYVESSFVLPLTPERFGADGASYNWDTLIRDADNKLVELGVYIYDESDFWPDDDGKGMVVEYTGYKLLRDGLGEHHDRNTFRYVTPGAGGHLPHDPKHWAHVTEESKAQTIAQYGSLEKADIDYAVQDYERLEALNNDEWNYVGIIAKMHVAGIVVGEASCWGFESDGGEDYLYEARRDLGFEAIQDSIKNLDAVIQATQAAKNLASELTAALDLAMPKKEAVVG